MSSWPLRPARSRPLRRLDGSVQFGLDPAAAVRIAGLTEAEVDWLRECDGGQDPMAAGRARGLTPGRMGLVLRVLQAQGLFPECRQDQGSPAARTRARVWVSGAGLTSARIADLLRHADVGEVARLGRGERPPRRVVDLVILVTTEVVGRDEVEPWHSTGVAHLPVVLTRSGASVGPLVSGVTSGATGPCLGCLDLLRADRDPSWSVLAAQARAAGRAPEAAYDHPAAAIAAGLAAHVALGQLDGAGGPSGLAWEVAAAGPTLRQHRWPTHPLCPRCFPATADSATMEG